MTMINRRLNKLGIESTLLLLLFYLNSFTITNVIYIITQLFKITKLGNPSLILNNLLELLSFVAMQNKFSHFNCEIIRIAVYVMFE